MPRIFMRRLLPLLMLLIMVSLLTGNWERAQWSGWGTPKAEELDFNEKPGVSSARPVVISSDEKITTEVFKKNHPSVVNIAATTLAMNFWRQVIPQQGQGTGFIIDKNGYVLTNNHVVDHASKISVTLGNGKKADAVLVGRDPSTDLAVIRIPKRYATHVAELGNSDMIKVGQKAIAIGNPFGLSHTLTTGIVSAVNRQIQNKSGALYDLIQTDAAINPGNSGGPLLNSSGQVIGVNTAIFSMSGGYQGIGFAIPVNQAKVVATQLITKGKYAKPWLGISGLSLKEDLSELLKININQGVLVTEVVPYGPAFKSGLKGGNRNLVFGNLRLPIGGDIIKSINGKPVTSMKNIIAEINRHQAGDSLQLEIWRDRRRLTLEVILEKRGD